MQLNAHYEQWDLLPEPRPMRLSDEVCRRQYPRVLLGAEQEFGDGRRWRNEWRPGSFVLTEAYLKGIAVCCEDHPTLGTEPQNILTDGMYLVMLPVGVVRLNTWKRQFSTSAT